MLSPRHFCPFSFFPSLRVLHPFAFGFALSILCLSAYSAGQDASVSEKTNISFAVTAEEKAALLQRAEEVLVWFRGVKTSEYQGIRTSLRRQISPLELMQAAVILQEQDKGDVSRLLRQIFPCFDATSEECFEIAERLGEEALEAFAQENDTLPEIGGANAAARIRAGAANFLAADLNPAEQMALLVPPQTATEIMQAVDILSSTGRPAVVRLYLQKFLDSNASPEECAQIAQTIGSTRLFQIAQNPQLAPKSEAAVVFLLTEARKHWTETGEIEKKIGEWEDAFDRNGDRRTQKAETLTAIWQGERVAIEALLEEWANSAADSRSDATNGLLTVIFSFGAEGREALATFLQSSDQALRNAAAEALVDTVPPQDAFLLFSLFYGEKNSLPEDSRQKMEAKIRNSAGKLPTRDEAAANLYDRAKDYYDRARPLKTDADGNVSIWFWDAKATCPKNAAMPLPAAYRHLALHYAEQAYRLTPDNTVFELLYYAALFDKTVPEPDAPLDWQSPDWTLLDGTVSGLENILAAVTPKKLQQVLQFGIESQHDNVALVAAMALGRIKIEDSEWLPLNNGKLAPIKRWVVLIAGFALPPWKRSCRRIRSNLLPVPVTLWMRSFGFRGLTVCLCSFPPIPKPPSPHTPPVCFPISLIAWNWPQAAVMPCESPRIRLTWNSWSSTSFAANLP